MLGYILALVLVNPLPITEDRVDLIVLNEWGEIAWSQKQYIFVKDGHVREWKLAETFNGYRPYWGSDVRGKFVMWTETKFTYGAVPPPPEGEAPEAPKVYKEFMVYKVYYTAYKKLKSERDLEMADRVAWPEHKRWRLGERQPRGYR